MKTILLLTVLVAALAVGSRADYGDSCEKGENTCDVDAFQACESGICKCSGEGVTSWYDGSKCVLLVRRSRCSTAPGSQLCVAGASCQGFSVTKECRCNAGFAETTDGHCV